MALTQHAVTLRDGIVSTIRAAFPEHAVKTVAAFDGVVDRDMLKRYAVRSPAVLVSVVGGDTEYRGAVQDTLKVAVYIITASASHLQRSKAALIIREHIVKLLPRLEIANCSYQAPRKTSWVNQFDGKIDEMGLVLWEGNWEQLLSLPALENLDDLGDFAKLWAEIFEPGEVAAAPETGTAMAEQLITLETEEP